MIFMSDIEFKSGISTVKLNVTWSKSNTVCCRYPWSNDTSSWLNDIQPEQDRAATKTKEPVIIVIVFLASEQFHSDSLRQGIAGKLPVGFASLTGTRVLNRRLRRRGWIKASHSVYPKQLPRAEGLFSAEARGADQRQPPGRRRRRRGRH